MKNFPQSHRDLLQDEARAFAYLATLMPDGSPQLTPLWFNADDEHILINSAKGRIKDRNMRARPRVALLITDPKDPFHRYVQVRGKIIEVSEAGALEHINALSLKYRQQPWTPVEGQTRVIYRVLPEKSFAE
jgi:PPOX class probable F420-dependent enzyme